MIDTRRWVIMEMWVALGLKIRTAASWEVNGKPWQASNNYGPRYYYEGHEVWVVEPHKQCLHEEDMEHEIAHYMEATHEQRYEVNFGLLPKDDPREDKAVDLQRAIATAIGAASHIASLALKGERRQQ